MKKELENITVAIIQIMNAFHTGSFTDTMLRLDEEIGDGGDIISQIQMFEKAAFRQGLPWLSLDLAFNWALFRGDQKRAAFLGKGLRYWRFIGFNDQVEMKVPDLGSFEIVFLVLNCYEKKH